VHATVADLAGNVGTLDASFVVSGQSPSVRVTFLTAGGQPIAGASVQISSVNYGSSGPTSAAGSILFTQVPAGSYAIFLADPDSTRGYVTVQGTLTQDDFGLVREIVLHRNLRGTVVVRTFAAGGTPLPGVRLHESCGEGCEYQTGADGTVTIEGILAPAVDGRPIIGDYFFSSPVTGTTTVTASAPLVFTADDATVTLDLHFPISVVTGVARFTDGTPVESVSSAFATFTLPTGETETRTGFGLPDVPGGFRIFGVPAGAFALSVQEGSASLVGQAAGTLADIQTPAALDVTIEPFGTVTGTVSYAPGQSVAANVTVSITSGNGVRRDAYTDATGHFELPRVGLGSFTVDVDLFPLFASTTGTLAAGGQIAVADVTLPPSGSVLGLVRDAAGTPMPWFSVSVQSSGLGFPLTTMTDAQGSYRIDYVPVGAITVEARNPASGLTGTATGTLDTAGQSLILDVDLPPTGTVVFTVQRLDGTAAGLTYVVVTTAVGSHFVQTDASGVGTIEGIPLGAFTFDVYEIGTGLVATGSSTVASAGLQPLTVTFPAAGGITGVLLVGNTATPAADTFVTVTLALPAPWYSTTRSVQTDASGAFAFDYVLAGTHQLSSSRCTSPSVFGCLAWERVQATVVVTSGPPQSVTLRLFP
jgi:hypothetical protein